MAFLSGRVVSHSNSAIPILAPLTAPNNAQSPEANAQEADGNPGPSGLGTAATKTVSLPRSTMIGDLKLTALRSRLTALGVSAEFAGEGVLVCSGGGTGDLEQTVAVRKMGKGKISVEGSAGDVYFAVRKEVYALHAVVSQA